MNQVYRKKCSHCGFLSEPFPENYLTVKLDEPSQFSSCQVHPHYPEEVIVPNSGVKGFLEAHGFTMRSAITEGRLFRYNRLYCRECGEEFEQRRYDTSGLQYLGTLWPILVSLFFTAMVGFIYSSWKVALIAFIPFMMATAFVMGMLMELKIRKNLAERIAEIRKLPRCRDCASTETTKSRLKCPQCGLRTAKLVRRK